jgi:hypothetical protein
MAAFVVDEAAAVAASVPRVAVAVPDAVED